MNIREKTEVMNFFFHKGVDHLNFDGGAQLNTRLCQKKKKMLFPLRLC